MGVDVGMGNVVEVGVEVAVGVFVAMIVAVAIGVLVALGSRVKVAVVSTGVFVDGGVCRVWALQAARNSVRGRQREMKCRKEVN